MIKTLYKLTLIALLTYVVLSFNIGLSPFNDSIYDKPYWPKNAASKYSIGTTLIILSLMYTIYTYYFVFSKVDADVLLSKA